MRDHKIDIMRFIGLSMIILAHVNPPETIFQLRNFDVPLMVLVSGMSFLISYKNNELYLPYLWKRAKRLLLPVWIFLSLYFFALAIFYPSHTDFTNQKMIGSYLLTDGIGYVWIIRVFLLVAIAAPLIYYIHTRIVSNKVYFSLIVVGFIAFEIVRFLTEPLQNVSSFKTISQFTHYIIPYSILFAIGLRLPNLTKQQCLKFSLFNLALFISIAGLLYTLKGSFIPTQVYKYPPSIYYFSYAIFVSCLLWAYASEIQQFLAKIKLMPFVLFVAQNSIWVYLWHILLVKTIYTDYLIKYVVVFAIASLITFFQVKFVLFALNKWHLESQTKRNIKLMLTG